ncbi:septin-1-like [Labrus mixtus]|uniref:septin-1-like n=1 Tax=Labrus mixtus TaxID=508554 RepID=UPI0029C0B860|nr:septin-1-like [Labrus mixtus]
MTLGNEDPRKIKRTILLVGETGAGKSTLINALVNYAIGVTWEDNVWFEIVEKDEKRDQFESQTSDVIVYKIFGFEDKTLPYSLTIIDTPGYGDTKGTKEDDIVRKRLLDLFGSEDGVLEINVVGLVLKASDNRLSDRLRYIFDSMVSLFGKNMEKNIVFLITHSDGKTPREALKALEAAKIKCAKDEKNQPVYFLFNNCQNTERNQKNKLALEASGEITTRGMKGFTDVLIDLRGKNLKTTTDVMNSRIRLTACIKNLQERVELIELQQREIQQTQENLKKHEEEMKSNKNFTIEVDESYKEKEPIKGGRWLLVFYEGVVSCNKCEENCHFPGCTMARNPKDCDVMKRGKCTACSGKCPASDHVKEEMRYETKTRKVQKTLQDVKDKFESSKSDLEKSTSILKDLEIKMGELEKDKDQWLEESFKYVLKLEKIALNVDSLSTHVHLDFLIERMKEKGDTEKVQKLEEMKSRRVEGTRAALKYMGGGSMKKGKM